MSYSQTETSSKTISLFAKNKSVSIQTLEPKQSDEISRMPIQINQEVFQKNNVRIGDQLHIDLFSGAETEATVSRLSVDVAGTISIIARMDSQNRGTVILTHKDERLFATVHLYDQNRLFRVLSDPITGQHMLIEMDKNAMNQLECGVDVTEAGFKN